MALKPSIKPPSGMPKTAGEAIDMMYQIREMRLSQAKVVSELKEKEDALADLINNMLDAVGLDKGSGKHANFTKTTKVEPKVEDWEKFYAYIVKKKAWDMLQKRPGARAIAERWKNGEVVPGVSPIEVSDYSLTKR